MQLAIFDLTTEEVQSGRSFEVGDTVVGHEVVPLVGGQTSLPHLARRIQSRNMARATRPHRLRDRWILILYFYRI
jgi:hypothetical protein